MLERLAAALAANRMIQVEPAEFHRANLLMEAAKRELKLLETNPRFQLPFYRASNNDTLIRRLDSFRPQYAPTLFEYLRQFIDRFSIREGNQLYEVVQEQQKNYCGILKMRRLGWGQRTNAAPPQVVSG